MKVLASFLPLLFLISCASAPERYVASESITFGEANASKSSVKYFTDTSFYLEFRDSQNALVDVDMNEIQVRIHQEEQLDSKVRRLVKGKYEVAVKEEVSDLSKLKFFVQKKILTHKLVAPHKPLREKSHFQIVSQGDHQLRMRLTLRDKSGAEVDLPQLPDIILEGLGEISDIQMVKKGVWEFSLAYPEENQILYLSVRANEVLLERLFRFQHIEK